METRQLGSSNLLVSALGLGCNAFGGRIDHAGAREVVHAALDEGVTMFDTADGYGRAFGASETMLGEILRGASARPVIATKGGANPAGWDQPPNASRAWLTSAVDASLSRIGIERIDLYQVHFPDPNTPIDETLRALDDMVAAGKVDVIGCSNFSAPQIRDAIAVSTASKLPRFQSTQAEYHLLAGATAAPVIDALLENGMSLLPYFPLAGGLLTGKYGRGAAPEGSRFARDPGTASRFVSDRNLALLDALRDFAAARACSVPDLAFGWLLAQPAVPSVIAGATTAAQVRANARSARCRFTPDDLRALGQLLTA